MKGDTVTITYGDTRGGSPGFRVQTFSNDAFPLPIYVNLRGNRELITLPIQTYTVRGGKVNGVHGFAPSVVKTGEAFTLSVRSEDFYYNRAHGEMPEYQVKLNGKNHSIIPAGSEAIHLIENIRFDKAGVYRFSFGSKDGKITGQANPVWVRDNPTQRVYWGDTHGHCEIGRASCRERV